jgi:hypothetical protein
MKNIPNQLIFIQRLASSSEFRGQGFHLGEVLLRSKIVFLGVVEGASETLSSGL